MIWDKISCEQSTTLRSPDTKTITFFVTDESNVERHLDVVFKKTNNEVWELHATEDFFNELSRYKISANLK